MTDIPALQVRIAKAVTNFDRLDEIVNGDATTVVTTDAGPVPSIAKLQADLTAAGVGFTTAVKSASYAETTTIGELIVLVTGAAVNVTLPSAVGNRAKITFKLTVAGTLTLTAASGETIDGGTSAVTSIRYTAITIVSDGANWQVI